MILWSVTVIINENMSHVMPLMGFIFIIKHLLDLGGLKRCSSDNFIVMIVLHFNSML